MVTKHLEALVVPPYPSIQVVLHRVCFVSFQFKNSIPQNPTCPITLTAATLGPDQSVDPQRAFTVAIESDKITVMIGPSGCTPNNRVILQMRVPSLYSGDLFCITANPLQGAWDPGQTRFVVIVNNDTPLDRTGVAMQWESWELVSAQLPHR